MYRHGYKAGWLDGWIGAGASDWARYDRGEFGRGYRQGLADYHAGVDRRQEV